ncbi:MAG: transporter substrate-binding domain-containing protein, partial [Microbacterium sp.]
MNHTSITSLFRGEGSSIRSRFTGLIAVSAAAALLVGCAGAESAPEQTDASAPAAEGVEIEGVGTVVADPAAAELLPERYSQGLTIASTIPHPPFIDFAEEGVRDKFVGVDFDLLTAIGAKLGTTITYQAQPFDGMIPGLQAGNFDVITGLADLKSRQETVTFVDYSKTGAAIVTRTDVDDIAVLGDLCGRKAAAVKDTTLQKILIEYTAASCGSNAIDIIEYPDEAASVQSVISGATDALLTAKVNAIMLAKGLPEKL